VERTETAMLTVSGLRRFFGERATPVRAVDGVSFVVRDGETYGLVGESGCGKSTTGRALLRLIEPDEGGITFRGEDLRRLTPRRLRRMRRNMQMVFQDPYASLDPRMTVEDIVAEPLLVHGLARGADARIRARDMLDRCGLRPRYARRHPHAFSGGQRQRVAIARALVTGPEFVVADEPVSALDVSIQSQITNLLRDLQEELGAAYLFISHDLAVVRHMADRVGVMYLGRIVEEADTESLFAEPLHPYSEALLSAVPRSTPWEEKKQIVLEGDVPSPKSPPPGCPFHTRCPYAMQVCRTVTPALRDTTDGRRVACHLIHPPEEHT
jgi:oligopeptide/dipeptide ABC transporter ATP-binding protein